MYKLKKKKGISSYLNHFVMVFSYVSQVYSWNGYSALSSAWQDVSYPARQSEQ